MGIGIWYSLREKAGTAGAIGLCSLDGDIMKKPLGFYCDS